MKILFGKIIYLKIPSMLHFCILSFSITIIIIFIYLLVAWTVSSYCSEKNSSFECGFDPLRTIRSPFSTRFFVLVVLFLIFDIEVSLLFPLLSILTNFSTFNLIFIFIMFILILLVGLFYEWYNGALDWLSFSIDKLIKLLGS